MYLNECVFSHGSLSFYGDNPMEGRILPLGYNLIWCNHCLAAGKALILSVEPEIYFWEMNCLNKPAIFIHPPNFFSKQYFTFGCSLYNYFSWPIGGPLHIREDFYIWPSTIFICSILPKINVQELERQWGFMVVYWLQPSLLLQTILVSFILT